MSMSFIDFGRAHGLSINPAKLHPSERIKRCPTIEHPKKDNGAYFWDGERGWVFAWDGEASVQWWNDPHAKPWTEEDKAEWKRKREAMRTAQQHKYLAAADRAQQRINEAQPGHHTYLEYKGLKECQGLIAPDGSLLVPMRNVATGKLQGVQSIRWMADQMRYEKKMQYEMQARNAVLRLGPQMARETILCEGYATGLSIELAARQMRLQAAVLVCFSDSNLVNVSGQIKGKQYAYADNDASGAGERAALDAGIPYCMSDTLGNDANDDHKRHGLMAVCKKLMSVRRGL